MGNFKDVVKAHPINPTAASTPAALSSKLGVIDAAASTLSKASYPLIADVDWTSGLSLTPLPGASPNQVLKAIDKAIGSVDAKLVTSAADYEAVNAALGKVIASVPT